MIIFSRAAVVRSKSSGTNVNLTVVTTPANATVTLTYNGQSHTSKTATVGVGTVINYSIYHSTYGTKTGSVTMSSNKTLICEGKTTTIITPVSWTRPNLTAFGTMGGSSFACETGSANGTTNAAFSGYEGWKALDGISNNSGNYWDTRAGNYQPSLPAWITWYNPTAIKVTQVTITQQRGDIAPLTGTITASNDNSSWTTLKSWSNSNMTSGASWDISLSNNTNYYKYYRWTINTVGASSTLAQIREITMTAYTQQTSYTYYWEVVESSNVNLTVVTTPADATCTLTYGGQSYSSKTATVGAGTVIDYSVYHSTYGTQTGSVVMDSDKTLTFEGTYSIDTVDVDWSQPVLTADGTMGGDSFAVSQSPTDSMSTAPYLAFNGTTSGTAWATVRNNSYPIYLYIYNPDALKITEITWNNAQNTTAPKAMEIHGSDDDLSWSSISTYTNTNNTSGSSWNISLSSNTDFYKYHRITISSGFSGYVQCAEIALTAKYQQTSYTYYWDVVES